ncbi:MAG: hypothetical protein P8R42_05595 [Candidatus Binatia bacterium]|nr:hypothetical protein [Candidatus Binatia bacterium]
MKKSPNIAVAFLVSFFAKLRFPVLFVVTAAAFLIDLVVPDLVPFADEIVLGLMTALLGALRKRREPDDGALEKQDT